MSTSPEIIKSPQISNYPDPQSNRAFRRRSVRKL
jgi:hypothetical protein